MVRVRSGGMGELKGGHMNNLVGGEKRGSPVLYL